MPQPRSQDSPLPVLKERARERERRVAERTWERGCQRPKILSLSTILSR